MRQLGLVVLLAGVSLLAPAQDASPQSQAKADAALPMYDVSVIRPAAGLENGDRHVWTRLNTLDVKNMPLLNLLQSAFDVPRDMIIGLPEWAKHERLDIEAKTLDPDTAGLRELTAVQRRAMLQALFKDRLGLQWHYETRVLSA